VSVLVVDARVQNEVRSEDKPMDCGATAPWDRRDESVLANRLRIGHADVRAVHGQL
jgi:hypothetical protein